MKLCIIRSSSTLISSEPPNVAFFAEVIYLPAAGRGCAGGLYDLTGQAINHAVSHRGNDIRLSQPIKHAVDFNSLPLVESDTPYFFIGEGHIHFGHFLLETMPRLWALLNGQYNAAGGTKYLYCGQRPPVELFKKSFIKDIFGCFPLAANDFINYREPCRLKNVFVAAPAFEICMYGHPLFRQTMQRIGSTLADNLQDISNTNLTPLYLSKSKLTIGVQRITNETDIEDALRRKGVDIWHPETADLATQIKELSSRRYIMGTIGSAMHTLLFCSGNKVISGLANSGRLQSSYLIIDELCGNIARYESGSDLGITLSEQPEEGFLTAFHAADPDRVAEILLGNLSL
jgi:hypothetical protein